MTQGQKFRASNKVRVCERDELVKNKTMATLVRQELSHSEITKNYSIAKKKKKKN